MSLTDLKSLSDIPENSIKSRNLSGQFGCLVFGVVILMIRIPYFHGGYVQPFYGIYNNINLYHYFNESIYKIDIGFYT